jgi:hypothetical protein
MIYITGYFNKPDNLCSRDFLYEKEAKEIIQVSNVVQLFFQIGKQHGIEAITCIHHNVQLHQEMSSVAFLIKLQDYQVAF